MSARARRLARAAGTDPKSLSDATDLDVCREVAFHAAREDSAGLDGAVAVIEELLLDESNYSFAMAFLEDLQNLTSHGLDDYRSRSEVEKLLGPRAMVCWATLDDFWASVMRWSARNGLELQPIDEILTVQNQELRKLLWTTNRTVGSARKLGLAHAIRYEKAGEQPIPGFDHIAVALETFKET